MRILDLETLEIFRSVVRQGGVVRAAQALNRVPSNVTTRLKQLEERLGVALFRRQGRGLVLTADGERLRGHAERLLQLADEAEQAMRDGAAQGPLRLGSLESAAGSRLPALLSAYHRAQPQVRVDLQTGTTGALLQRLAAWEVEAAFVSEPFSAAGCQARPFFDEELVLITALGHAPVARPADLGDFTLIAFAHGCSYRQRLQEWLGAGQVLPARTLDMSSYPAIIACVAAGTGCAVVPVSVLQSQRAGELVQQHALPARYRRNRTHLVWQGTPSPALAALIALLDDAKVTPALRPNPRLTGPGVPR
ncbi:LysR family transcriptional regulator [Aquabacterium sp. OR-4]|uniref:LysR family transcriptional regulator n=1 Tax=Aquabacterium sp. OR-4 TaxID=2978127 RepID=UPI0021B30831|nr:LysR family transcriptional regulator [Aquabacterium sp. OR-4]MDT7835163.1 LysR family transcriptional regulator [Aquabacterium sp. OR-4]